MAINFLLTIFSITFIEIIHTQNLAALSSEDAKQIPYLPKAIPFNTPPLSRQSRKSGFVSYALVRNVTHPNLTEIYVLNVGRNYISPNGSVFAVAFYACENPPISPESQITDAPPRDESYFQTNRPCEPGRILPLFLWAVDGPKNQGRLLPDSTCYVIGASRNLTYLVMHVTYQKPTNGEPNPNISEASITLHYQKTPLPKFADVYRVNLRGVNISRAERQFRLSCRFLPVHNFAARASVTFYASRVHSHMDGRVVALFKLDSSGKWTKILMMDPRTPPVIYKLPAQISIYEGEFIMAVCLFISTSNLTKTIGPEFDEQEQCNVDLYYYSTLLPTLDEGSNMCEENQFDGFYGSYLSQLSNQMNAFMDEQNKNTGLVFLFRPNTIITDTLYNYSKPRINYTIPTEFLPQRSIVNTDTDSEITGLYGPQYEIDHKFLNQVPVDAYLEPQFSITVLAERAPNFYVWQGLGQDPCGNLVALFLQSHPHRNYQKLLREGSSSMMDYYSPSLNYAPLLTIEASSGEVVDSRGQNQLVYPHDVHLDERGFAWVPDLWLSQVIAYESRNVEPTAIYFNEYGPGRDFQHFCKPSGIARYLIDLHSIAYISEKQRPRYNDTEYIFIADGLCDDNRRVLKVQSTMRVVEFQFKFEKIKRAFAVTLLRPEPLLCVSDYEQPLIECANIKSGKLQRTISYGLLNPSLSQYRVRKMTYSAQREVLYAVLEHMSTQYQYIVTLSLSGHLLGRLGGGLETRGTQFEVALALNESQLFVGDSSRKAIHVFSVDGVSPAPVNARLPSELLSEVLSKCSFRKKVADLDSRRQTVTPFNYDLQLRDLMMRQAVLVVASIVGVIVLLLFIYFLIANRETLARFRITNRMYDSPSELLRALCFCCDPLLPLHRRSYFGQRPVPRANRDRSSQSEQAAMLNSNRNSGSSLPDDEYDRDEDQVSHRSSTEPKPMQTPVAPDASDKTLFAPNLPTSDTKVVA